MLALFMYCGRQKNPPIIGRCFATPTDAVTLIVNPLWWNAL